MNNGSVRNDVFRTRRIDKTDMKDRSEGGRGGEGNAELRHVPIRSGPITSIRRAGITFLYPRLRRLIQSRPIALNDGPFGTMASEGEASSLLAVAAAAIYRPMRPSSRFPPRERSASSPSHLPLLPPPSLPPSRTRLMRPIETRPPPPGGVLQLSCLGLPMAALLHVPLT